MKGVKRKRLTHNKKVIPFRQPKVTTWSFADFVYPTGNNPFESWYEQQTDEVQETIDSALKNMAKTEDHLNWTTWRGYLRGDAKRQKIWEIGFFVEGRQYRIFGIFSGSKVVILLAGCYHKGKIYEPRDAIETATKRAAALREGTGITYARQVRIDL